jgi:protein disulfide-isomerase-like protein
MLNKIIKPITIFFKKFTQNISKLSGLEKFLLVIALVVVSLVIYKFRIDIKLFFNTILVRVGIKQQEFYTEEPSQEETSKVESTQVKSNKGKQLVLFFAPWCPHCQDMLPGWDKFAEVNRSNVSAKKVNSDLEPELVKEYDVQGFPTILLLDGSGKTIAKYEGERDTKSLSDFVNRQ